jgi:hypothetical protein
MLVATATPEIKAQFVTRFQSRPSASSRRKGAISDEPELDELRSYVAVVRAGP